MRIVKCIKCGHYIYNADCCFHCGNTIGFDNVFMTEIHDNAANDYERLQSLVEERRYNEAIETSYNVLEWMPHSASVYWLRLLAKYRCSDAGELIYKGFSCEDSDFQNALDCSTGTETMIYEDIKNIVSRIKQLLINSILSHRFNSIKDTGIIDVYNHIQNEIDTRKKNLFSLWHALEKTEQMLFSLELRIRHITKEHQIALKDAVEKARVIKQEVYQMKICDVDKMHDFQTRLGSVLLQSNESKIQIESMKKNHPWVRECYGLVTQRNRQTGLINTELSSLEQYKKGIEQILATIEEIETLHNNALNDAERDHFSNAASIIGTSEYYRILKRCGMEGVSVKHNGKHYN